VTNPIRAVHLLQFKLPFGSTQSYLLNDTLNTIFQLLESGYLSICRIVQCCSSVIAGVTNHSFRGPKSFGLSSTGLDTCYSSDFAACHQSVDFIRPLVGVNWLQVTEGLKQNEETKVSSFIFRWKKASVASVTDDATSRSLHQLASR